MDSESHDFSFLFVKFCEWRGTVEPDIRMAGPRRLIDVDLAYAAVNLRQMPGKRCRIDGAATADKS
jgi:hypothetical protein